MDTKRSVVSYHFVAREVQFFYKIVIRGPGPVPFTCNYLEQYSTLSWI